MVDGERVAHHRLRVEDRPLARGDGDLGELFVGGAVLVHVADAGGGVDAGRPADVVGHLELGGGEPGVEAGTAGAGPVAVGVAGLAVSDEGDLDQAGLDGGGGVLDVDDEGGAADGGAVGVLRLDAEVLRDLERGRPAGAGGVHAVHLRHLDAGVGEGVAGGLGVELQGGLVGDDADLVGLVNAGDGDAAGEAAAGAGPASPSCPWGRPSAGGRGRG